MRPPKTTEDVVAESNTIFGVLMKVGMPMLGCPSDSRFKTTRRELDRMLPMVKQLAHVKKSWIKEVESGDELWISIEASKFASETLHNPLGVFANTFSIGPKEKE